MHTPPFRKILVANDESEGARKALAVAVELAQLYAAELHVMMVEEHLPQHRGAVVGGVLRPPAEVADHVRGTMINVGLFAMRFGVRVTQHVTAGHEVETIITFLTKHQFDVLVLGFMGHSKLFGHEWGSTSQNLTRLAPCHVLVVK